MFPIFTGIGITDQYSRVFDYFSSGLRKWSTNYDCYCSRQPLEVHRNRNPCTTSLLSFMDRKKKTVNGKGGYEFFKRRPRPKTASGRESYLLWYVQNTIEELMKLSWPRDTMHNVPIFFKTHTGEHQGEHRDLVYSCPEATEQRACEPEQGGNATLSSSTCL